VSPEREAVWATRSVWTFLAPPGIKPRILDRPARSVITILTALYRSLDWRQGWKEPRVTRPRVASAAGWHEAGVLTNQKANSSIFCVQNTGLFETIVGVWTTCHLVLQMQPHVISFCGVTSRIRFMFLLFPQVSRNWRYESELPLKPSPLTCYKQFGTNSVIVLMFVESQRVYI